MAILPFGLARAGGSVQKVLRFSVPYRSGANKVLTKGIRSPMSHARGKNRTDHNLGFLPYRIKPVFNHLSEGREDRAHQEKAPG
jgi:hypothetical protein